VINDIFDRLLTVMSKIPWLVKEEHFLQSAKLSIDQIPSVREPMNTSQKIDAAVSAIATATEAINQKEGA
jgi:hypothetical protein